MSGHLFVVLGDIRKLACDAWAVPCDRRVAPRAIWQPRSPALRFEPAGKLTLGRNGRVGLTRPVATKPPRGRPVPYLVDSGGTEKDDPAWYAESARDFVQIAAKVAQGSKRARRLLALPVLGTGRGGASRRALAVLHALIPAIQEEAARHDVDVALVTNEASMYSAAQHVRRERLGRAGWNELGALTRDLDHLAHRAKDGGLVLFLGAGLGIPAGLPDWRSLLDQLAEDCGMRKDERQLLASLDHLDAAALIERRIDHGRSLGARVAERLHAEHYALGHALLASLPVSEAVTTNYDTLFEQAVRSAARRAISVLPHDPDPEARRWLLKLHGCVRHPEDLVLTRASYVRYDHNHEALAGIVQALLLTKHMLFVGFSLTDDNFHRIADAVRRVRGRSRGDRRAFGTTLVVESDGLSPGLWKDEIGWVSMGAGDRAERSRRLEIALDYLAAEIQAPRALFDRRFRVGMDAGSQALVDALGALARIADRPDLPSEWSRVAALLTELGWKEPERSG